MERGYLDLVLGDELGEFVKVVDLVGHQGLSVPEVEGTNIVVDSSDHVIPFVLRLMFFGLPADFVHRLVVFAKKTCVVHQFFRDAADVNTGSSQTPFGSSR